MPAPIGPASPVSATTKETVAELLAGIESDEGAGWWRTAGHREKPQREKKRKASWDLHRGDVRTLGM